VILDLRADDSLVEAGFAREVKIYNFSNSVLVLDETKAIHFLITCISSVGFFFSILIFYLHIKRCCAYELSFPVLKIVNRIQKLRKKSGLEPTDFVEVYFQSLDEDESVSKQVLVSQVTSFCLLLNSSELKFYLKFTNVSLLVRNYLFSYGSNENLCFQHECLQPHALILSHHCCLLNRNKTSRIQLAPLYFCLV